jgi:hypothetical protein
VFVLPLSVLREKFLNTAEFFMIVEETAYRDMSTTFGLENSSNVKVAKFLMMTFACFLPTVSLLSRLYV